MLEIRPSTITGLGVFATRPIAKGTRIIEYTGEVIGSDEADRRYDDTAMEEHRTYLFALDDGRCIDGAVGGNDARLINHSCDPNCESVIEKRRVFIEAIRDIEAREELGYDYQIGRERGDPPNVDEIYACRCGAAKCRGTMLWPPKRPKRRKRVKAKSKTKSKVASKPKSRSSRSKAQRKTRGKARNKK